MKPVTESPEVFEAYATIDVAYYMLEQLGKKKAHILSPIEKMIDEVTGYGKKKLKKDAQEIYELLQTIIDSKKIIEADFSNDLKMQENIKRFL